MRFVLSLLIASFLVGASSAAFGQTPRPARVIAEKANLRETPSIVGLAEGEVPEG